MKVKNFNTLSNIDNLLDAARFAWTYAANHDQMSFEQCNNLINAIMEMEKDTTFNELKKEFKLSENLEKE